MMNYLKMGKVGYWDHPNAQPSLVKLKAVAEKKGVATSQLALAWLHKHSNELLDGAGCVPIPGTSSAAHLIENVHAVALAKTLTSQDMLEIETAVPKNWTGDGVVGAPNSPTRRYGGSMIFEKTLWTDVPDTPTPKNKSQ